MVYSELKQAIADELVTDEETFQRNVDMFIRTAERRIYASVRTPDSRATVGGTFSVQLVDTEPDFQDPLEFTVTISGAPKALLLKEPSFITEAYPVGTGAPRYYAILDSDSNATRLMVGPAPDIEYTYKLRYLRIPPSIIEAQSTWLGDHAHHALLYESLVDAYIYLKGDPVQLKTFRDLALEARDQLKVQCELVQHMDAYRNPEIRTPV